ncbi:MULTISPECIES: peroxide stress protein YaaA [unclassified Janthinobacterium]|uniref:peroxide stress protein YaaA n=1 Tax=unclassified Janthinobacterium TaxID=2610881 RepID=UPI001E34DF67|nr:MULTISPECIES: peroxide stress protein YaaA [unclassified Janthinobacterium]MCC7644382.1 peroxide stress protein YaaA [Janthinobacterium sp. EB271-G4-3-1]MCC7694086.1 peroxide stress protein YaaA [Janthinobacterium sp. EB271-G4-3-2]
MLIVLSPAKSLDLETPPTTSLHSTPDFLAHSAQLIARMRQFSPAEVGSLMGISDALSALNVARYASWTPQLDDARQAIMAFNGDVYAGFEARSLQPAQLDYAQSRVRILSGLYGLLRPLDLIHPHRLEMGTRLSTTRGKDLYAFWGDTITNGLNRTAKEQGAKVLVNLASEEYFKSVKPRQLDVPVIAPVFEDWKNGKYKIISFYAKRARGMLARYAAVNQIRDPEQLKQFDVDGYAYVPEASNDTSWVFRRKVGE